MANNIFGYVRVSSTRQGEGVSLDAQKEAIENYAKHKNLQIVEWFTEKQTAAKVGRPEFDRMLKLIKQKKSIGAVFHKIDRATRNHLDWARIIDLRDNHDAAFLFAGDDIDMNSRAGRLLADIIMSISKGYVDNLREETLKGLYGRLRQGIYPFKAPISYVNNGKGRVKTLDPRIAPVVKAAFELYAEGNTSLEMLSQYLAKHGVFGNDGQPYRVQTISKMLHNPFYMGIMRVKGKSFIGKHPKLVSSSTFQKVQDVLQGKVIPRTKHNYLYRKTITCSCNRTLIGEKQRGRVYYRCHVSVCSETSIREDYVTLSIMKLLDQLSLTSSVKQQLENEIKDKLLNDVETEKQLLQSQHLQRKNCQSRLENLTDMYLDKLLDALTFETKRDALNNKLVTLDEKIESVKNSNKQVRFEEAVKYLEQLESLCQLYKSAKVDEKRKILKSVTSSISFKDRGLRLQTKMPFNILLNDTSVFVGDHVQSTDWNSKGKITQENNKVHTAIDSEIVPPRKMTKNDIIKIADAFTKHITATC